MAGSAMRCMFGRVAGAMLAVAAGVSPMADAARAADPSFADRVRHADVARGRDLADSMCSDCHNFDRDGSAMMGPNLYGLMGTHIAAIADYNFSPALLARRQQVWTVDTLSAWLKNPAGFAPGTRMGFDGVVSDRDRADIVAYLGSLSGGK